MGSISDLDRLRELRDQQESLLADCEPQHFAALSREYRLTIGQITAFTQQAEESQPKGSPLDELQRRRSARGAAATG